MSQSPDQGFQLSAIFKVFIILVTNNLYLTSHDLYQKFTDKFLGRGGMLYLDHEEYNAFINGGQFGFVNHTCL